MKWAEGARIAALEGTMETGLPLAGVLGIFPLILIIFVLGLVVFAGYLLLGGAGKLMDRLRDETGPRFLQETIPTLLPWDPSLALPDMSSICRRRIQSSGLVGGRSHSRGTVQSLRNSREAWVAFAENTQSRLGTLEMYTSQNKLEVHVRAGGGKWGDRRAMVAVDGRPLGMVGLGMRELFDPEGRPLGRITGGLKIWMQGMTNYQTLKLGGEAVAEVNREPLSPFERLGPSPPAFHLHRRELSEEEEWWVMASFAVALFKDSLSSDP